MAGTLGNRQLAFIRCYLGPARFNGTKAARMAGYTGSDATLAVTASDLLRNPKVAAVIAEWREQVQKQGIADIDYRVSVLDDLHQRYQQIIDDRVAEYEELDAYLEANPADKTRPGEKANIVGKRTMPAGGKTGLVMRQVKTIGTGRSAQMIEEFVPDTATPKAMQSLQDQVAKELGQRVEKHEHTGKGGAAIEVKHRVDLSSLSDDDLRELKRIRQKLSAADSTSS